MNPCSLTPTELVVDAGWLSLTFLFLFLALAAALIALIAHLEFEPWP